MIARDQTVLAARSLTCGYPDAGRTVLRDVELGVRAGRFLCIIGPNGAGKTTLLRTLAGLLPAIAGSVELGGRPLAAMHATERARRLSVVLTRLDAPGYLTVGRFVELGRHPYTGLLARLSQSDHEAVEEALSLTGMRALHRRWMAEISDGERQRAAVARALAQAGDVMILDEPTAFLDVAGRAAVMTTLRRIAHRTGRAIVTTSHDVELVLRTADSLVVIDDSGALTSGSPEDLILNGSIARLFPDPSLEFDPRRGSFRLPHPTGSPVRLVGHGLATELTAHALERIGRPVAEAGATAPLVEVREGERTTWSVTSSRGVCEVTSIEELAELLRE